MTRNARPKSRCLGLTYAHPSVQDYALVLVDTVATDSMGKSRRTSGDSSYSFMHVQHTFQLLVWPCHGASRSGCFPPANCTPVHVPLERKTTQIDEMPAIYRVQSSSVLKVGFREPWAWVNQGFFCFQVYKYSVFSLVPASSISTIFIQRIGSAKGRTSSCLPPSQNRLISINLSEVFLLQRSHPPRDHLMILARSLRRALVTSKRPRFHPWQHPLVSRRTRKDSGGNARKPTNRMPLRLNLQYLMIPTQPKNISPLRHGRICIDSTHLHDGHGEKNIS